MPNYCTNNLTVTGDAKEIKRFHDAIIIKDDDIAPSDMHKQFSILDNLFPTPQDEIENWYEWNCKNYGSKWSDFDGVFGQVSDNEINATFMSAWSPIGEGIRNVSKLFPTLDFVLSYDEGGMAFCGGYAIRNGEIFADIEGVYPSMTVEQSENEEYDEFYEQVSQVTQAIESQCKEALSV